MITALQIKAARALLEMKQRDLAKKAGVSIATLNNIERGAQTDPRLSTMKHIEQALHREGIHFTNDAFEGLGVRLKPRAYTVDHATILIIDDNKADRTLYKTWLKEAPGKQFRIVEADCARAGLDAFVEHQPQCIILDFMMYGADGFQLLAALRREPVKLPPIIFVTGMHNEVMEESVRAQNLHAYSDADKALLDEYKRECADWHAARPGEEAYIALLEGEIPPKMPDRIARQIFHHLEKTGDPATDYEVLLDSMRPPESKKSRRT